MELDAGIDRHGRPFVRALTLSDAIRGPAPVTKLIIDTGAARSVILDRDREIMGLDVTSLARATHDVVGIGGVVPTFVLKAQIGLLAANDEAYLWVPSEIRVLQHMPEIARHLAALDSLLGRDILGMMRLTLDLEAREIRLEA